MEAHVERFTTHNPAGKFLPVRHARVDGEGLDGFRGGEVPAGCRFWHHVPASLVRERVGSGAWDRWLKFCAVRSPFDRAVSGFFCFERHRVEAPRRSSADELRDQFERCTHQHLDHLRVDDRNSIDGRLCVDVVLRHERQASERETLCGRLGLPRNPEWLTELKRGVRPLGASVTTICSAAARARVEAAIAEDLARFGCRFPQT